MKENRTLKRINVKGKKICLPMVFFFLLLSAGMPLDAQMETPFEYEAPNHTFESQKLGGELPSTSFYNDNLQAPILRSDGWDDLDEDNDGSGGNVGAPIDGGFVVLGAFVLTYALFIHFRIKLRKKQEEEDRKKKRAIQSDDFNLMIK